MDTDGKTCEIEDEDEPAVRMRSVCIVFPFENQPKHQRGEHRRVSINLTFYGREPKSVAPSVSQSTSHTTSYDGDGLRHAVYHTIGANEFARQVCDAPEEEQDAERGECGTHHVDPISHLFRT